MKNSFAAAAVAAAALSGALATAPAEAHDRGRGHYDRGRGNVEIIIGGPGVVVRAPIYGARPYYAPPVEIYVDPYNEQPVIVAPEPRYAAPAYRDPYGYNRNGRGSVIGLCEYPVKTYINGREYRSTELKQCVIR